MNSRWKWYFPLVLTLVLATAERGTASNAKSAGLILETEGKVLLKRQGWLDYCPTSVGTQLYPGDRLLAESGATVTVLCADLTRLKLSSGETWNLASSDRPPPENPQPRGGRTVPPRGDINPLIPYIISPRSTFLLDRKPILRWNAVPGASRYSASVISDEDVLWEAEVSETQIIYPGDPPLELGVDYLLIVDADTGASSSEEDLPSLGFSLLDEIKATLVRDSVMQLVNLNLASEALALAKAHLYIGYELREAAIETLEVLVKQGSETAAVYSTLGAIYEDVRLSRLALTRYLRAAELTANTGDLEGQAVAAAGLGEVYQTVGNIEAAKRWLTQARDKFAALGDTERVKELENWLN